MFSPMQGCAISDEAKTTRPRQFTTRESSGVHESGSQHRELWNVDRFLKNGVQLFYVSTNLEVAVDVLQRMGKFWKSAHSTYL